MLTLFDQDTRRDQAFAEFHRANPAVFAKFRELAEQALDADQRVSARCIGERIRWFYRVELAGHTAPRFNDLIWPRYARLLVSIDARFEGFFEFRDASLQGGAA